jgi:hypothetical protein
MSAAPELFGTTAVCPSCAQSLVVPYPVANPHSSTAVGVTGALIHDPLATFDLSGETPERLEGAHLSLRLNRAGKNLWMVLGMLIFAFIFGWLTYAESQQPIIIREIHNGQTVGATKYTHTILPFLAAVGAFGAFVYLTLTLTDLIRPLRSGKTPEATCHLFYEQLLGRNKQNMSIMPNYPRAFVCLLDAAKEDIGNYKGFEEYWIGVHRDMSRRNIPRNAFTLSTTRPQDVDDSANRVTCSLTLAFGGDQIPVKRYFSEVELRRIGSRWYLTSGRWPGLH